MPPRDRESWELCEANTFSGIHTWILDVDRDPTGKAIPDGAKVARCHVCQSRPNYPHEADVVKKLLEAKESMSIRRSRAATVAPRNSSRRR